MGWQLLSQKEASKPNTQVGLDNPSQSIDAKIFYPFTFPLTIGPGGMAVVFTFSAHFNQESLFLVSLRKALLLLEFS